jgi:iron complex outermembrane receptor protein
VYIDNAASSAIRGVEAETQFLLSENWSMEINFGYLDATFDEYVFAQALDFSGNTMPRAPEHTLAIALNYSAPVAWGQVDARLAYAWRDKVYFEADNNVVDPESSEDSLGLLDFSVALTASDWTFSLWGHNLSDERYRRSTLNSTGSAQKGIWAEPRTYGLKVQYDFGQ